MKNIVILSSGDYIQEGDLWFNDVQWENVPKVWIGQYYDIEDYGIVRRNNSLPNGKTTRKGGNG